MKIKTKSIVIVLVGLLFLSPLLQFNINTSAEEIPYGPWIDEIEIVNISDENEVVKALLNKSIDLYPTLIYLANISLIEDLEQSNVVNINYAYGIYDELTFNPANFSSGFNPFINERIREAFNYVVNRSYIAYDIYRGFARPKWVSFIYGFPEYNRFADVIHALEAKYAYNFTRGREIIFSELQKMNCSIINGTWHHWNGTSWEPITIKVLIRIEDQRKQIGDYIADQLQQLNFTVEKIYKSVWDAVQIWFYGNPAEGKWNIYTGGWVTTAVSRDDSGDFALFYTPLGLHSPLWQAYKPDPEFYEIAERLWNRNWTTWDERNQLITRALELSLADSARIWLVDRKTAVPYNANLSIVSDKGGGFNTPFWCRTAKWINNDATDVIRVADREILVNPFNPIDKGLTIFDELIAYCFIGYSFISNPYNGLPVPDMVVNVSLVVDDDIYTNVSSSWISLTFAENIPVPVDSWKAWNYTTKAVVHPSPNTYAKVKVVVNYGDVIGKLKFHDGSVMSVADWILPWIFMYERSNPNSNLYDESVFPKIRNLQKYIISWRIVSEHPLIIEYYTNYTSIEAEAIVNYVTSKNNGPVYWPEYPWHDIAIGILAENNSLAAFTSYKAGNLNIPQLNYAFGETLQILKDMLDYAINTSYIPFQEIMSNYTTKDEAIQRYSLLHDWYNAHSHFLVGLGPYYVDSISYDEKKVHLRAYRQYRYKADHYEKLVLPPPSTNVNVEASGPTTVTVWQDLVYDVNISGFGLGLKYSGIGNVLATPDRVSKIDNVYFSLLAPNDSIVYRGEAIPLGDYLYRIIIPGEYIVIDGNYVLSINVVLENGATSNVTDIEIDVRKPFYIRVTLSPGYCVDPSIVNASNYRIFLAWASNDTGTYRIYTALYNNTGERLWLKEVSSGTRPNIAATKDYLFVAWMNDDKIRLAALNYNGEILWVKTLSKVFTNINPVLTVGDGIYISWVTYTKHGGAVVLGKIDYNGRIKWIKPISIGHNMFTNTRISFNNSKIYVAYITRSWNKHQINILVLDQKGRRLQQITLQTKNYPVNVADIAVKDKVYILYNTLDHYGRPILEMVAYKTGVLWYHAYIDIIAQSLTVTNHKVYVAYINLTTGYGDLFFAKYDLSGNLQGVYQLTHTPLPEIQADMAYTTLPVIIWSQKTLDNYDILMQQFYP